MIKNLVVFFNLRRKCEANCIFVKRKESLTSHLPSESVGEFKMELISYHLGHILLNTTFWGFYDNTWQCSPYIYSAYTVRAIYHQLFNRFQYTMYLLLLQ